MDKCCIHCFCDSKIHEIVEGRLETGRCSFCGTENSLCFDPLLLATDLEITTDYLILDENGEPIDKIYEREFRILSSIVNNPTRLWEAILGVDFVSKKYKLKYNIQEVETEWADFKNDLIHNNRFFPKNTIYSQIFTFTDKSEESKTFYQVIDELKTTRGVHDNYHRARVSEQPLTKEDMGQPPLNKVSAGRANPDGIAYLYLAEELTTAILEVRPSNGATVYVSRFNPNTDLNLIDLTNPKSTASFLNLALNMGDIEISLKHLKLLELFAEDLAKPILPEKSNLEYIPTQFICEFFKSIGKVKPDYDGIIFSSSFGKGKNIVLFDSTKATNTTPLAHKVTETVLKHFEIPPF